MGAHLQPNLIDVTLSKSAKNGLRLAGFDIYNTSKDRPVTPDGHKLMIEMWQAGANVYEIGETMKLSEARLGAELYFLAIKGLIMRRK